MGLLGSSMQEVLGVLIDGHQVQVAHLRRQGKQIVLAGMDQAALVSRMDLGDVEETQILEPAEASDILGLSDDSTAEVEDPVSQGAALDGEGEEEQAPETNSEVLYRLLDRFPVKQCSLAVSLMEANVFFTGFGETFGLKGKRLKARLILETEKERTFEGGLRLEERHAFFQTGQGGLLSIVHEDPLEILDLVDELAPFIGRVQVGLIEPLEVTLMNLVRVSYPPEQHVTAVVFVGEAFSRVVFMKNGEYLAFSQSIHEGADSPQALNTLYSRILFEQDVSDLPEIGRVLLAGGCRTVEAQSFFAEQFPDAQVDYLCPPELDLSGLDETEQDRVSCFAVPIGLAWKALCSKDERFYPVNFLPRARRRQQNPLEVAWHGLVVILLLMLSALFLGMRVRDQERAIETVAASVNLLEQQIGESSPYVMAVDSLHAQIKNYERSFALIDVLSKQQTVWHTSLRDAAGNVKATGGLWLERFSTSPEMLSLYGKAVYPERVPGLASRFGVGHIQSIVRSKIREKTVYGFEMRVPMPSVPKEGP